MYDIYWSIVLLFSAIYLIYFNIKVKLNSLLCVLYPSSLIPSHHQLRRMHSWRFISVVTVFSVTQLLSSCNLSWHYVLLKILYDSKLLQKIFCNSYFKKHCLKIHNYFSIAMLVSIIVFHLSSWDFASSFWVPLLKRQKQMFHIILGDSRNPCVVSVLFCHCEEKCMSPNTSRWGQKSRFFSRYLC